MSGGWKSIRSEKRHTADEKYVIVISLRKEKIQQRAYTGPSGTQVCVFGWIILNYTRTWLKIIGNSFDEMMTTILKYYSECLQTSVTHGGGSVMVWDWWFRLRVFFKEKNVWLLTIRCWSITQFHLENIRLATASFFSMQSQMHCQQSKSKAEQRNTQWWTGLQTSALLKKRGVNLNSIRFVKKTLKRPPRNQESTPKYYLIKSQKAWIRELRLCWIKMITSNIDFQAR